MTRRRNIAIVDYGVGNFSSVQHAVRHLGHRCAVSDDPDVLGASELIILPGVGAFPAAMAGLVKTGLDGFVQSQAAAGQPIIGLCLGMQLLVEESAEHGRTSGLGLIPGAVNPLGQAPWHIGWNTIESANGHQSLGATADEAVYFNHSYVVETAPEFHLCTSRLTRPFASGIRRVNVVGLQFHPEKSQAAGRGILQTLIEGLCNA